MYADQGQRARNKAEFKSRRCCCKQDRAIPSVCKTVPYQATTVPYQAWVALIHVYTMHQGLCGTSCVSRASLHNHVPVLGAPIPLGLFVRLVGLVHLARVRHSVAAFTLHELYAPPPRPTHNSLLRCQPGAVTSADTSLLRAYSADARSSAGGSYSFSSRSASGPAPPPPAKAAANASCRARPSSTAVCAPEAVRGEALVCERAWEFSEALVFEGGGRGFSLLGTTHLCRPQKCAGQAKRQQQNALLPVCPRIRQYICFIFSHVNAAARAGCTNVAHACISKGAKSTLQVACAAGVDAYFHTFLCAPSLFPDSLMLRQAAAKHWSAKSKEEKAAWAP